MKAFAALLDRLSHTPGRETKLALIGQYLDDTPDPDRGWGLAALAGELDIPGFKAAMAKALILERVDGELFALSYDYVGDLAETVALLWPEGGAGSPPPSLGDVVERPGLLPRDHLPDLLAGWLDGLDATGRWALLKLATGGLRVGVSAKLARAAFARWAGLDPNAVEEAWFIGKPPYPGLFAWAAGGAPPDPGAGPAFRPFMLAPPLEPDDRTRLDLADYAVEWKWDGIRVQLVGAGGEHRIFSRGGEEITEAFPDLAAHLDFDGAVDGELLVLAEDGGPAPFTELQKRLNRKRPGKALIAQAPARARLYDILVDGTEDLRPLPFRERRARLEAWFTRAPRPRLDLSPLVPVADWEALEALRAGAREAGMEGLMLKRWAGSYRSGRPRGEWFKAKRDPLVLDAVLLYAQRGHGGRSGLYSDFTFGVWTEGEDGAPLLVPIGKAYSGFTDAELKRLNTWVKAHQRERFGPVRALDPELVVEVAFDAVQASSRHKAGLALRFPRIKRIRWDKPADEADQLTTVAALTEEVRR